MILVLHVNGMKSAVFIVPGDHDVMPCSKIFVTYDECVGSHGTKFKKKDQFKKND